MDDKRAKKPTRFGSRFRKVAGISYKPFISSVLVPLVCTCAWGSVHLIGCRTLLLDTNRFLGTKRELYPN